MKQIDHAKYPGAMEGKTSAELRYIIADANDAVDAMPEGTNVSYYLDEINYASDELARRETHRKPRPRFPKRKRNNGWY